MNATKYLRPLRPLFALICLLLRENLLTYSLCSRMWREFGRCGGKVKGI